MADFQTLLNSFDPSNLKGKQFEKFCKWYLENDPVWKNFVKKVWLWADYPERWADKDLGIDLVCIDIHNKVWAIQAKCYQSNYYITYDDMAKFIAESNRSKIDHRLLMATTNNLGANAKSVLDGQDNKPVVKILLDDFQDSKISFPKNINLIKQKVKVKKPKPIGKYSYQKAPIDAAYNAFKKNDRGQLIMACGTGKTFTTLWVKEKLKAKNTIILLPSLSLLSQTLKEWNFAMNEKFSSIAICSDSSVSKGAKNDDRVNDKITDLSFPVTTNLKEIKTFLKSDQNKVVFITYQSSPLIADAMKDKSIKDFDLAIADEAHRCAGNKNSDFSTILDNKKIRAKKRLFVTATPRFYGSNVKNKAMLKDQEIIGMDDKNNFGEVFYRLSFSEAIKKNLLTDYQLVIVGVDNKEVLNDIKNREILSLDDSKKIDAKSLASYFGLLKTIKKYDLKKIITFHSRVNSAKAFSDNLPEIMNYFSSSKSTLKDSLLSDHVSGEMNAGLRRTKLDSLKLVEKNRRKILTNARCLSEGIDVPALDAVALIDPKFSQIDIIQIVGRAIRLSSDKKIGTIFIPIYLESGKTPQEIIEKTNFKSAWNIINALRAHDDGLAEELDMVRTSLGEAINVHGKNKLSKIYVDIPKKYDTNFKNALNTVLINSTSAEWFFRYGELIKYYKAHEDIFVPESKLCTWIRTQRGEYSKKTLSKERFELLNKLDYWFWNALDYRWERSYGYIKEYSLKNNLQEMPVNYKYKKVNLYTWMSMQREKYKEKTLSDEKIMLLESLLGWQWLVLEENWNKYFNTVKNFLDANPSKDSKDIKFDQIHDEVNIGKFLNDSLQRYKQKKLEIERIEKFESLKGWYWETKAENTFKENFKVFKVLWDKGVDVGLNYVAMVNGKKIKLGKWVSAIKDRYINKTILPYQIDKMNSLKNWTWEKKLSDEWNKNFEINIKKFKEDKYFHNNWVGTQRKTYKNNEMKKDRIKLFDAVDNWFWHSIDDEKFLDTFQLLVEYEKEYGNCNVPKKYTVKKQIDKRTEVRLGEWVMSQKRLIAKNKFDAFKFSCFKKLKTWKF